MSGIGINAILLGAVGILNEPVVFEYVKRLLLLFFAPSLQKEGRKTVLHNLLRFMFTSLMIYSNILNISLCE